MPNIFVFSIKLYKFLLSPIVLEISSICQVLFCQIISNYIKLYQILSNYDIA